MKGPGGPRSCPPEFGAFRSTWTLEVIDGQVHPDSGAVPLADETVVVVVWSRSLSPLGQLQTQGTASRLSRSCGNCHEHERARKGNGCNERPSANVLCHIITSFTHSSRGVTSIDPSDKPRASFEFLSCKFLLVSDRV